MRRRGMAREEAFASMSDPDEPGEDEGSEDESRIQEATEAIKRLTPEELDRVLSSLSDPTTGQGAQAV